MTSEPPPQDRPFKPTFIRQWRKHRRMTLEALAPAAGMSVGNLSNIERGITGYNQETLESLAKALQCHPAELLLRNPADDRSFWSLWEAASPEQQRLIMNILEGVLKSPAA